MIRLIASDLDGTLLQNGAQSLTPETIAAIEQLAIKHNILFVAASGRQYPNLYRLFGSASKHMAFICENGSLLYYKDSLIFSKEMDRTLALSISHDIMNTDGCEVQLAGRQTVYIAPKGEEFYDYLKNVVKNDVEKLTALEEMPEPIYKVSVFEQQGIEHHGPTLAKRWEGQAKITVSGGRWMDFVDNSIDKGAALTALMQHLSIRPEECAAFGDNFNDIEMLHIVAYGYIMDNAVEELKKRYSLHCKDVLTTIYQELI